MVGAGYTISEETGDVSTVVKLFRVTLLAPVVFIGALVLRNAAPTTGDRPPLMPLFVLAFLLLAALNSYQLVPAVIGETANTLSRTALVIAVAAVGMKTSLERLRFVGGKAIAMLLAQTVFIGGFVALSLYL